MYDLIVAFLDPLKIILFVYLIFKPKTLGLAIGLGVAIALFEAGLGHLLGASIGGLTFFESAPSHLIAGIALGAIGNMIGQRRLKGK